jgi:hypothetical protein
MHWIIAISKIKNFPWLMWDCFVINFLFKCSFNMKILSNVSWVKNRLVHHLLVNHSFKLTAVVHWTRIGTCFFWGSLTSISEPAIIPFNAHYMVHLIRSFWHNAVILNHLNYFDCFCCCHLLFFFWV